jgi:hypothetical protein
MAGRTVERADVPLATEHVRLRRTHDTDELLALTEPLEPETVLTSGELLGRGLGRDVKAWIAEDGRRNVLGWVVFNRVCRGRWSANTVLLRDEAAGAIGKLINRSNAWEVAGSRRFVEPLRPHLTRARREVEMPLVSAKQPLPPFLEADPRVRWAEPSDLEQLVDLFDAAGLELIPTRQRLRRYLRDAIVRLGISVAEEDGRIVAATRCESRTQRFEYWGLGFVLPAYRRRGLAWKIGALPGESAWSRELRVCFLPLPTNPMPFATSATVDHVRELFERHEWLEIKLQAPKRFRGQAKLRKWTDRFEDRLDHLIPRKRHRAAESGSGHRHGAPQ